jgi:hypothetical protein
MQKEIQLKNDRICFTLKKSKRAKHVILNVGCDAKVSVTIPWQASEISATNFIQKKSDWLIRKIKYFQNEGRPLIPGPDKKDYAQNKELAQKVIEKKIERFNAIYQFPHRKISVRNQKTRWGSCSRSGNLSFCYRIIYLPEDLSDYVIVHELCHLQEFNHSENFWALVRQTLPNFKELRKRVRVM